MRKSKKKILNQLLAMTLSVSMATPNVVALADPIMEDPDSDKKTELVIDDGEVGDEADENTSDDVEESTEESKDKVEESTDESKDETEESTEESKDETEESTDESKDETEESTEESKDDAEKSTGESKDETEKSTDESKGSSKDETKESSDETKASESTTAENKTSFVEKVEELINDLVETVTGKKTYEKFGSDAFILWWFDEATDDEKSEWYASISKYDEDKASASDAKYPAYSSDEFDDWFNEKGIKTTTKSYTVNGETVEVPELNITNLASWIKYQSEEDAIAFINEVLGNYYAVISGNSNAVVNPTSVIGDLWPESWGANADYRSDGHSGVKEDPYVLDSVEDLRAFARDVANGLYNEDSYFLLKHGTYDLGGTWIPIGFCLNNGNASYVPFKGHFAGEDGTVIKNLGFKASNSLNVGDNLAQAIRSQKVAGLFGIIEGATINNIQIQTSGTMDVNSEMAGILAGCAIDSAIRDVEVSSSGICGTTYVGGLVGVAKSSSAASDARDMVIEDVTCSKVAVYTNTAVTGADEGVEGHDAVGGVVGYAVNASVIDSTVTSNTGSGKHIYGKNAFVGGIVGVSEQSDILNSFLQMGNVGENNAFAVGGIVGGYAGGAVKVARFSGTVVNPTTTNNYKACFIGYRVNNAGFVYGENGDIAYLFADSKSKADTGICGSRIEDDGIYDEDAWIGYWHSDDTYCTIVSGDNQSVPNERFYEILENGILNAKNGTRSGNGYENTDTINHYTADKTGNPTRGYLLTVENPLVDGVQAAEITAYVNGSYKETVSADNLGAFAPGDQVYISFSDMKDNNGYYRMDTDKNPCAWYSYYKSGNKFYTYDNYDEEVDGPTVAALRSNGGWVLTMPDSDVVVGAEYEKVAEAVTTTPAKVTFEVTQTRSGDRANPEVKWSVTAVDQNGVPITDTNGTNWNAIDPTNNNNEKSDDIRFWIGSMVNQQDNQKYNLTWTTSNTDENGIISKATAANANVMDKQAYVTLNLYDSALNKQIEKLVKAQHDGGDKDAITTIEPYYYHSVVTAVANPDDCDDKNNPPKGYCDITIKLNIVDKTNTKIEGVALSQDKMTYNVVRTLSGDRANPTVNFTVNGDDASSITDVIGLKADFTPDYFSNEDVKWYLSAESGKGAGVENDFNATDDGTLSVVMGSGDSNGYRNATVTLKGVTKTSVNNTFISGVISKQDQEYTSQMMKTPDKIESYTKYVKVTAKDAVNNSVTDTCTVTVNFKTIDNTEIMPTDVKINNKQNLNGYKISYTFKGDSTSEITDRTIRMTDVAMTKLTNGVGEQPTATVYSGDKIYDNAKTEFTPYNDSVTWELALADGPSNLDPYDVLNIDKATGQITVRGYDDSADGNGYSPWVQSLIGEGKLDGTTVKIRVIVRSARDNSVVDYQDIPVTFVAASMDNEDVDLTYDMVYTKTVGHSIASAGLTENGSWAGNGSKYISATATGASEAPIFALSDDKIAKIVAQESVGQKTTAEVMPRTDAQWIKEITDGRAKINSGSKEITITSKTKNGTSLKTSDIVVNYRYDGVDLTASVPAEIPEAFTSEYLQSMASIKDRDITLDVVATQGNYSQDNPGTRTWQYGIVKLDNITYSADGVKENDATYTLSGDLANYAKVENGYIVPIKGLWESEVINKGNVKGSVSGVLTATKDCSGVTTTDSYFVTVNFRYDKAVLDRHEATFNVVYTDDSRTNSKLSHWTGDDFIQLYAQISDESGQDVTPIWESSDTDIVTVDKDGRVYVNEDTWIKEIIDAAKNDYDNETHSGTKTVTVTAKHPTTGKTADTCVFTVNFRYDQAILNRNEDVFTIVKTQTSRTLNPSAVWSGNDIRKLTAKMHVAPGMSNNVTWSSEDSKIVTVDEAGNIQPVIDADWMNEIIANQKYTGQKKVAINADNDKLTIRDSDNVTVNFIYEDVEMAENNKDMNITVTATGSRSNPTYTVTGDLNAQLAATIHSSKDGETGINWSSADGGLLTVDGNGKLSLVLPTVTDAKGNVSQAQGTTFKNNVHALIREALNHAWSSANNYITSGNVVITAASTDNRMADQCTVKLNIKFVDNSYSSSGGGGGSSSGGSSGGGGGSSSTGVTPSGTTTKTYTSIPSYVVKGGQWTKNALDKWFYTNGRTYTNEWAAIINPYADAAKGQSTFDWFHFNQDSTMTTGWYVEDGYTYYLHPVGDGTQGRMYTGWNWIDDNGDGLAECYYFETESNGHKGMLYKNTTTPDGYKVNEKGQWVENGVVITREASKLNK